MAESREAPETPDEEAPPEGMAWWIEVARAWGPAIFAVLLIRTFVFEPFRIPSGSMIPTLLIGDFVVVNKSAYGVWVPSTVLEPPLIDALYVADRYEVVDLGDPKRGDIIVFRYPRDERTTFIKRVVGIPGDRVKVTRNQVKVNDETQEVDYVSKFQTQDAPPICRTNTLKLYDESFDGQTHQILMNPGGGQLADRPEVTVPDNHVMVMGDNRDNSDDSRSWGFVRFDQIKGKAHFVWMSWDSCAGGMGSLRADRLFHGLYQE